MKEPQNRVEALFSAAESLDGFAQSYFSYLGEVLARVDRAALTRVVNALLAARASGGTIYTLGNGGSAATAAHFANDLVVSVKAPGPPFRAQSLSANVPILTAVSNDFGYDRVFVHQLEGRLSNRDVVIAFSASGNSPNVVEAIRYAAQCGAATIGFSSFDGGALKELSAISVHVPTQRGEYGPAEDAHLALEHMLTSWLALTLKEGVRD